MTKSNTKPKSEYLIQTVHNAVRLLEAFERDQELGVSELSRRLGLHKNNVFRLLATLEESGYIEQSNASDRYRLGVSCLGLGQAYSRGNDLLRRARPILEALVGQVGETAHLGVLRSSHVFHLDGEVADQLVVTGLRVGSTLSVHCTALGKVLLGCAPEKVREEFDRRLGEASDPLDRCTSSTIVDRDKLFEHLRSVAVQGFALDLEECSEGLCCAAAPVFDRNGAVLGALSVSGPAFRLTEDRLLREAVPAVCAAASELGHALGA